MGQLAIELEKNNIQTIFAVTENVTSVYKVDISLQTSVLLYKVHIFLNVFFFFLPF